MENTLHDLIGACARFGATPDEGVCRLTGSPEDKAARDWLAAEMQGRGLALTVDPIGNMFGSAMLVPETRAAVAVGSHLDSQPTGGRFDGAYGVLAGLLAVEVVQARAKAEPGRAQRNLVLANWTNEEGARFQPSLTGSSVFTGALSLESARSLADGAGVTLGDALLEMGYRGEAPLPLDVERYVELHVEQGASLEDAGVDIGIVTGAWATRKMSVVFQGEPSHTGPMPMARRRDALRAAARAIEVLYEEAERGNTGAHASAARISVTPNSPNVVAATARVWFEARHWDEAMAYAIGDRFLERIRETSAPLEVEVMVVADERRGSMEFDTAGAALVAEVAADLRFTHMLVRTIAGHDALALQRKLPSSLIFVPSREGLSHNPREFTDAAALDKGLAVLSELLWRMVVA